MRRFNSAVAAIAALIALGLPATGQSQPPDRDEGFRGHRGKLHDRGPERFLAEHADELGLSAETREAIEKIVDDSRERAERHRAAWEEEHAKMRALLKQPMPDEKQVMELTETIAEGDLEQRKLRMQAMLDIRKLLTEEQRAQLVGLREANRARHSRFGALRGCRRELPEVCPEAARGRETLQCLAERWDELSEECREGFTGRGRRGFGRPPGEDTPAD